MDYLKFISIYFLAGIIRTGVSLYIGLYYKNCLKIESININGSSFLKFLLHPVLKRPITLSSTLSVPAEIIGLTLSEYISNTYNNYILIFIGTICTLFRVIVYFSIDRNTNNLLLFVIFGDMLRGLSYGFLQISGVNLAKKLATPSTENVSQIIFYGLYNGISYFVSGILFSQIFTEKLEQSEFKRFYLIIISIVSFKLILIAFYYVILSKKMFKKEQNFSI